MLGLIYLRYAEKKYAVAEELLGPIGSGGRRKVSKDDYLAEGVIFLPETARFSYDWRKKGQAKGGVRLTLEIVLDRGFPESFDEALYERKCDATSHHLMASYGGPGRSVHAEAPVR